MKAYALLLVSVSLITVFAAANVAVGQDGEAAIKAKTNSPPKTVGSTNSARWAPIVIELFDEKTDKAASAMAADIVKQLGELAREGTVWQFGLPASAPRLSIQDIIRKHGAPDSEVAPTSFVPACGYIYGEITFYTKQGSTVEGIQAPVLWLADGLRKKAKTEIGKSKP